MAQYFPHYRTGAEPSFSQNTGCLGNNAPRRHLQGKGKGGNSQVQIFTSGGIYKPDKVLTALPIKKIKLITVDNIKLITVWLAS